MKVTEVSRHSYCMYYLLDRGAYTIAPGVKVQAFELGKHPLFRRTVCGPTALTSAEQVTFATCIRAERMPVSGQRDMRVCSTMSH